MLRTLATILLAGIVCLLSGATPAAAQQFGTLTGTVTDTEGEPLPGANVILVGTQKGTSVGEDGSYQITQIEPGEYTVRVSFVGYKTVEREDTFQLGRTVTQNFRLEVAPLMGEGVTVTVGSRARDLQAEDLAVPVDVYGAEEIQVAGSFETGQILQQIAPSVNFPQQTEIGRAHV